MPARSPSSNGRCPCARQRLSNRIATTTHCKTNPLVIMIPPTTGTSLFGACSAGALRTSANELDLLIRAERHFSEYFTSCHTAKEHCNRRRQSPVGSRGILDAYYSTDSIHPVVS